MTNSELAPRAGRVEVTGHGFPIPNEMGEAPMNIVFAPPKHPKTIAEMINTA